MNFKKGMAALPLVSLLAGLLLQGCKKEPVAEEQPARPAKLFTVKRADELTLRRYPGVVEANETRTLSFKVSGTIVELNARLGQQIKKGDLIARLDPRDYELALKRAQSQLQETQAQERAMKAGARPEDIRILEQKVQAAQAQFERDRAYFIQRQGLVERGVISREEFQANESAFNVSKANLESAQKELEKGRTGARKEDIEAIEARVRDLQANVRNAQNALDDTQLKTPFDAIVVERFVETHEEVQTRQSIARVQQVDFIKLAFDLPENVVFNLERANPGTFHAVFPELPNKEFPVELKEFRIEASPKARTFSCWVVMKAPEGGIVLPGMTADIIHRNPRGAQQGFPVPASAVFSDETKAFFVWKVKKEDMSVHKTPVEVGPLTEAQAWVTKGIEEDDVIVAAGASYLTEGMQVYSLESKE
jgi:multidrug efflux pump subunit AcrA (membrane-fusion protein)